MKKNVFKRKIEEKLMRRQKEIKEDDNFKSIPKRKSIVG